MDAYAYDSAAECEVRGYIYRDTESKIKNHLQYTAKNFRSTTKNIRIRAIASWINNEKVMVAINTRGKDADKFWLSLMHGIYHVLQKK